MRRRLRRDDQRRRPRGDTGRQPHRRHDRGPARRNADRRLGRQPDAHGERLPPPVHARLGDAEFDDAFIYWPTPAAGAASCAPVARRPRGGLVQIRLLSPAPGSSLPVPIARSHPIRIAGSVLPPPPPASAGRVLRRGLPRPATTAIRAPRTHAFGRGLRLDVDVGRHRDDLHVRAQRPRGMRGSGASRLDQWPPAAGRQPLRRRRRRGRRSLVLRRLRKAVHTLTGPSTSWRASGAGRLGLLRRRAERGTPRARDRAARWLAPSARP